MYWFADKPALLRAERRSELETSTFQYSQASSQLSKERGAQCTECNKRFNCASDLAVHMRTHTGDSAQNVTSGSTVPVIWLCTCVLTPARNRMNVVFAVKDLERLVTLSVTEEFTVDRNRRVGWGKTPRRGKKPMA